MPRDRSSARRLLIRQLIEEGPISSQAQLLELLAGRGHRVSQATVSRDLTELGVAKVEEPTGGRYRNAEAADRDGGTERLRKALADFLEGAEASGNIVVLHVAPATAGAVAAALDECRIDGVVGSVAGDDTIIVVTAEAVGGARVVKALMSLLEE
jgi:transcriptional regulator of arginine metabolism